MVQLWAIFYFSFLHFNYNRHVLSFKKSFKCQKTNTRMHKIQIMQKCVKFKKSTLIFPYSLTITSTNLIISWIILFTKHVQLCVHNTHMYAVCVLSHFSRVPTLCDLTDCRLAGSSVKGFSWQEYWSGLPFPSPGDLPNPGMDSTSLMSPALAGGFFTTSTTWETPIYTYIHINTFFIYIYISPL